MCLDLIISVVVLANLGLSGFFVSNLHKSKSRRMGPLWRLIVAYAVVSTILIVGFYLLYTPRPSLLGFGAGMFYLLVGSFVFTIEVPGFLLLKRHDQSLLDFLEDWRSEMVRVGYDFKNFTSLKSKTSTGKDHFEDVNLEKSVDDFIEHSDQIQNIDKGLWTLTISEVNRAIDQIQGRSKHPAPELIEILSLSGLSFLIAQILRLVG